MNEEQIFLFEKMQRDIEDLRYLIAKKIGGGSADVKANIVNPSTVPSGSLAAGAIDNANMFAAAVVDQTAIGANAVGQSELSDEEVTITISDAATSNTATITSGAVIAGTYLSAFSGTPTASYYKLEISGTTLTATVVAAPGAGNSITIKVRLIKT